MERQCNPSLLAKETAGVALPLHRQPTVIQFNLLLNHFAACLAFKILSSVTG